MTDFANGQTVTGGLNVAGGTVNTGGLTTDSLTTTGNVILGDAQSDTLNIGNGDLIKDASGNLIQKVNGTAPALTVNNTFVCELTSNTLMKIKARGSDGVTRSVSLTLA